MHPRHHSSASRLCPLHPESIPFEHPFKLRLTAALLVVALQPAISASGTFTPATLQAVRYLLAAEAAAAAGPAAFKEAGSLPQERGVQWALVAAVESELEALPTSLDEDFQLLQVGPVLSA
jgi:hypothetical protein